MNILQIIDERWDSGITNYALVISNGLKKRGHKVIVAGLEDKPPTIQARRMYLNVQFLSSHLDIFGLIRIIKQEKIDLINVHTGSSHFLAILSLMIMREKVPIIRTRGDIRPPKNNLLNKLLYYKTDKFIAAAEFVKQMYKEIGIPEEKLVTVYQGIDIDKFPSKRKLTSSLFSEGSRGKRIGIVARLDPVKGHFSFLKAMSIVKKEFNDIEILIVGKEENIKQTELQNLAKDLGIQKNILFVGYTLNVPEIMDNCDIGVISSIGSEAVSRVLLEWMATGKPVVATKVGIIPEVVQEGVTGFVVAPDNIKDVADKVIYLLQNEDKLKNMGITARKFIEEKFNEETFIKNTEKIYRQVLDERKMKR